MKHLRLIMAVLSLFSAIGLSAQEYQPRETWPYVFDNFVEGNVMTKDGKVVKQGLFNITVTDGSLHFMDSDRIMKADMASVHFAKLGPETYLNNHGKMYRVVVNSDNGFVLESVELDLEAKNEVNIGYGISSATASARKMSGVFGASMNLTDMSFMKVVDQKNHGEVIPVKSRIWINVNGLMIEGTRKNVSEYPGIDPKAAKDFFKANKPKWSDSEFLGKCLDFVCGQLQKQ